LDLVSYNLSNRAKPLTNNQGHITEEAAKLTHSIFANALRTDQSEFSPLLAIDGEATTEPPYLAVGDKYNDFVRSELITLSKGKLKELVGTTATLSPSEEEIKNVAAVVLATGFDPSPSINFLPEHVLQILAHSLLHTDLALALSFHGTHHPTLPTLGFVGFYRSPYWGVMEMQARFLAALWAPQSPSLTPHYDPSVLLHDSSLKRVLLLRDDPRCSQFPMGDYAYLMQEFASTLQLSISPPVEPLTPALPHNSKPMDILTPARYVSRNSSESMAAETLELLKQTNDTAVAGLTSSRFVARAVFRSLLGTWKLERDLVSRLQSHPNGHFSGTARFLLREGTLDGLQCVRTDQDGKASLKTPIGMEYLYIEDGEFRADNGLVFRASRRYVWRYDEQKEVLSVWFVKTDDAKKADYLFHDVEFYAPSEGSGKGWLGKAGHLCIDDFYDVNYEFLFQSVNLKKWNIGYTVKGPKKDYTIQGTYQR
jgi:hypothetical protein